MEYAKCGILHCTMIKALKILGWILLSIVLLLIGIMIYLQTPSGKRTVTKLTVNFLEKKFQTKVVIGSVDYKIPTMVGLQKVMFLDQGADTMLSMNYLEVDIRMLSLLKNKLEIDRLELDGLYARMRRNANDTFFNYEYIIEAFASANVDTLSKEEDTSASSMLYDIDKVLLRDITFIFDDQAGGTYFDIVLDSLLLRPKEIDPARMIYRVEDLIVYRAESVFRSFESTLPKEPEEVDTSASELILEAANLRLVQSSYTMLTEPDSFYLDVDVGRLEARLDLFDLVNELIRIDGLNLVNTQVAMSMGYPTEEQEEEPDVASDTSAGWRITSNKINLADIYFKMDDPTAPKQGQGLDYSHMELTQVSLILDDLMFSTDSISGDLTHLAAKEKSGLTLREMRTKFLYHPQGVLLEDLYVLTPSTLLQDRIEVKYPSLDALSSRPEQMYLDINMAQSRAAIDDILIFTPLESRSMLTPYSGQSVSIDGNIRGFLNQLYFDQLRVAGLNNTALALTGALKGLPDPDRLAYDFQISELKSSFRDVKPFVPEGVLENVKIPEQFSAVGSISGTLTAYRPHLRITTSDGNATIDGTLDISRSGAEQFDIDFTTDGLNLGKILKQDSMLGIVTMQGSARGSSFDINTMNAEIQGKVARFDFQNYSYTRVNLDATIANQIIDLSLQANDPNASIDMVAQIDMKGEDPAVVSQANIHNINLQAIGFTGEQLILGGRMDVNFSDLNPDKPVGYLSWKDPILNYEGRILDVDSIYLSSAPTEDSGQNIEAYIPDLLHASLTGNIQLTQIGNVALSHINKYFTITDTLDPVLDAYDMDFRLGLRNHPTLATFFPDLKRLDTLGFEATLAPNVFMAAAYAPKIIYGDHNIENLQLKADDSNQNSLQYALSLDKYSMGDALRAFNPNLNGYLRNDSMLANFSTTDSGGVENYALGAMAHSLDDQFYASLLPNLKLNYENWSVSNNEIAFGTEGFYVDNLKIFKENESIDIRSSIQKTLGAPIDIDIRNFELAHLSRILNPDTLLVEGTLFADMEIDLSDSFPLFKGDLNVQKLAFFETPLGVLDANVSNQNANTYQLDATISELGNNIRLAGLYHLEPVAGNNLDMKLNIGALSLKRFEGMAMGYLRDSDGLITGELELRGLASAPRIDGSLLTNKLQTRISMLNSLYRMPSERIEFSGGNIRFDNFKILDSMNQEATLAGTVNMSDLSNLDLNLNFKSNRWMATNSTSADYQNFYGKLLVTSNININGTASAPLIDGSVTLHDSTNFTYANVDEGPGISDHEGIVLFVDNVAQYEPITDSLEQGSVENQMTMNINLETEKYARFNVLVDPLTGDMASVFGTAFLNASMLPGGSFSLTGTYQIEGGYYELFIELIRRQFKIREGSTIQLAGDPMDAELNLEAYYEANIAPYDLMEKTASEEDLVFYKQRLPFEILLKITGKPLSPNIAFDIVLPDNEANAVDDQIANNIQAKLRTLQNDAAELNKQVFGVLVFGRFLSEDPMNPGTSTSMEYYARQSASRFLSQQLNNLASRYVNGLELSLDVQSQEDYTTGQKENRTSVNLQASKKFFNDRLTVNVGNDFQVEGRQLPGRENALIPGNISLDYKLTRDGKYVVRGYRRNEIQNVIDGYVIETGTALRLNYEYNRFQQLFRSREQLREARRRERERQRREEEQKNEEEKKAENPVTAGISQEKRNKKK